MSDSEATTYVPASSVAARGNASALGSLLMLCIVLVLAALGWFVWQQQQKLAVLDDAGTGLFALRQQLQQADSRTQILEQQLQAQQQTLQQLQLGQQQAQASLLQQLQVTTTALNDQSLQMARMNSDIAALQARVADSGEDVLRTQLLAEAAGMLRLAELRLQLMQDTTTAEALVRGADALLTRIADPAIAGLRARLANDLAALQAVKGVDVLELYRTLGAFTTQLDALQAVSTTAVADLELQAPAASSLPAAPDLYSQVSEFLGRYFVITPRNQPVTPLLTPEQHWLVRKSIALQLQQAALAVLAGDAALYKLALTQARAALDADLQGPAKAALLTQLDALMDMRLRASVPSLAATIAALQQLQDQPARAVP